MSRPVNITMHYPQYLLTNNNACTYKCLNIVTASVLWSYPEKNGRSWLHSSGSLAELYKSLEVRLPRKHEWRGLRPGWGVCHWIRQAGDIISTCTIYGQNIHIHVWDSPKLLLQSQKHSCIECLCHDESGLVGLLLMKKNCNTIYIQCLCAQSQLYKDIFC